MRNEGYALCILGGDYPAHVRQYLVLDDEGCDVSFCLEAATVFPSVGRAREGLDRAKHIFARYGDPLTEQVRILHVKATYLVLDEVSEHDFGEWGEELAYAESDFKFMQEAKNGPVHRVKVDSAE